jgi:heat shock protein HslJ
MERKQLMAKELIVYDTKTETYMRGLITIGLAILLLAMMSCKSTNIAENNSMEEKNFWVNSSKFPCMGVGPMSCLQVQENDSIEEGKWEFFYSEIEGFEYQPGNIYRLRVKVKKVQEPIPADASSLRYELLEVMEKYQDMTLRLTNIWLIKEVGDIKNPKGMTGEGLTIEINVAERRFFGYSGCNTIRGSIKKIMETEIQFGKMASTMMACRHEDMQLERKVTQSIEKVSHYLLEDNYLSLLDSEKNVLVKLLHVD